MIKLQEMRTRRNMTQKELSRLSGVSQQAISFIEIGKRENPGAITLLKLAKVLRCSLYDLIDEKEGA